MEMNQEIKTIIEKNLPAHVGAVLQERLRKADDDEKRLGEVQKHVDQARTENITLRADNKLLKEMETAHETVLAKIAELKELERDRRVFEAETKLQCALSENANMVNFVGMVFKSPVYKNKINQDKNYLSEWDHNAQQFVYRPAGACTTEERTEE
jgi:hypothetical protein